MDSEIIPALPETDVTRRIVAEALRIAGQKTVLTSDHKVKTYFQALSDMIWQGAVEGNIYFADGATIEIPDLKEGPRVWLDLVKFISAHLDGPAGANVNIGTANVYKVYQGFDPDRV